MIDWCLFIDKLYFHKHLSFWKSFFHWSNESKINFEKIRLSLAFVGFSYNEPLPKKLVEVNVRIFSHQLYEMSNHTFWNPCLAPLVGKWWLFKFTFPPARTEALFVFFCYLWLVCCRQNNQIGFNFILNRI